MPKNITWLGQTWNNVPALTLPQTGGGTARFTDTSPTTCVEEDVTAGKIFFKSDGSQSTGTNSGGGGTSKNAQSHHSTTRAQSTSYTSLNSLTCSKTGTYTVMWTCARSSTSGTWGSQLYIGGTAYGTAQTGSWSNHVQNITLTEVDIDKDDTVAVYGRSRGNSYYIYCGQLTIIEE